MGPLLAPLLLALQASATPQGEAAGAGPYDKLLLRYASDGWSGSVLVAEDGREVLARGYGFADFESNRTCDADTLFEVASITQTFTAGAIVFLAQENRVALDDPIGVYLSGIPEHSRGITLRHLLAHTSGIPERNAGGMGLDLTPAVIAYLGSGPERRPGTKWERWEGGYALLAGVIERAGESPYRDFLEEALFAPAGMSSTGFAGDADLDVARAALVPPLGGPARRATDPVYGAYGYEYRGLVGVVSTVRDLMAWDRALSGQGLLDEDHRAELFSVVANEQALGFEVTRAANGGVRQSRAGAIGGFAADFRRLPESNGCIVVLSNGGEAGASEIADNLEALLFGRSLAHTLPRGPELEDAEALAGSYACSGGRMVLRSAPGVVVAGIEGEALLRQTGVNEELAWGADLTQLSLRAVEIVEGIGRGDTGPLRTYMAKRIPKSWPDRMRSQVWPAQLSLHGEFRGARPLGAVARDGRVEILIALEHERGPARALAVFGPAGLELIDWQGPQFLVTARLRPVRAGVFRLHVGEKPVKIEFELEGAGAKSMRVGSLKLVRS